MLTTEGPSGPSCSSQVSAPKGDERSQDSQAANQSELALKQSTQFSIREYVYTSRKKDIETNWPFPPKCLQLCLKRGIKFLLPPFEPPDSVRSHCCFTWQGPGDLLDGDSSAAEAPDTTLQKASCSYEDATLELNECCDRSNSGQPSIPEPALQADKQTLCEGICEDAEKHKYREADVESVLTSHAIIEQSDPIQSGKLPQLGDGRGLRALLKREARKRSSLHRKVEKPKEPPGKKYRLIVKLGSNPDLRCADELSSNSSMISDPMASKICPVCKTFTSSSNTTLNAHIDQCLSMESNPQQVIDTSFKHKVKPNKKRLMVDIYATAPHCTIEDLDRRNGTSWALDLASLASRREICMENKKQKISSADQAVGQPVKGAVYIDSDGTKVCILSKLNAATPSTLAGPSNSKKLRNMIKRRMRLTLQKRRHLSPRQSKHMKVKTSRRKENYFGQIHEELNIKLARDEKDSEVPSSQIPIKRNIPGGSRHLISSKSSVASKMLLVSPNHKKGENISDVPGPLINSGYSYAIKGSAVKHSVKLSHSVDATFTLKTKSMNALSNAPTTTDDDNRENQSQCILENDSSYLTSEFLSEGSVRNERSKPSYKLNVFPRKKLRRNSHLKKKFGSPPCLPTDTSKTIRHRPSMEEHGQSKVGLSMRKMQQHSSEVEKQCRNISKLIVKQLRKRRSIRNTCKEFNDSSPIECSDMDNYDDILVGKENAHEVHRVTKSDITINHHQVEQRTFLASQIEEPGACTIYDCAYGSPCRLNTGEYRIPKAPDMEMHVEHLVDSAAGNKFPLDGIADPAVISEQLTSGGLLAVSDSSLKSWARLVENDNFIAGKEDWSDTHDARLFDHPMTHCDDGTSNGTINSGHEILGEAEFRVSDAYPMTQYMECQTNTQQVLGSSTCQSSSTNTGTDIPHGNSSVTSAMITSVEDPARTVDSEPSESLVSGTSNISHPSGEESHELISQTVIRERYISEENGRRLDVSDVWESGHIPRKRNAGECNQEMLQTMLCKQHENNRADQYCCCWRRESACHESQSRLPEISSLKTRQTEPKIYPLSQMYVSPAETSSLMAGMMAAEVLRSPPGKNALRRVQVEAEDRWAPCEHFQSSGQNEQHSIPNPVLRLMGKDVLVVNKDEDRIQRQNSMPCSSSGGPSSSGQCSPFLKHAVGNSRTCALGAPCQHNQYLEEWKYDQHMGMPWYGNPDLVSLPLARRSRLDKEVVYPCHLEKAALRYHSRYLAPLQHHTKEVILIEDSEVEAEAETGMLSPASTLSSTAMMPSSRQSRQSSCIQSQYPFLARGFPVGQRPMYPNVLSSTVVGNPSEARDHHLPRPVTAPSVPDTLLTRPHSMVYYFQS